MQVLSLHLSAEKACRISCTRICCSTSFLPPLLLSHPGAFSFKYYKAAKYHLQGNRQGGGPAVPVANPRKKYPAFGSTGSHRCRLLNKLHGGGKCQNVSSEARRLSRITPQGSPPVRGGCQGKKMELLSLGFTVRAGGNDAAASPGTRETPFPSPSHALRITRQEIEATLATVWKAKSLTSGYLRTESWFFPCHRECPRRHPHRIIRCCPFLSLPGCSHSLGRKHS